MNCDVLKIKKKSKSCWLFLHMKRIIFSPIQLRSFCVRLFTPKEDIQAASLISSACAFFAAHASELSMTSVLV